MSPHRTSVRNCSSALVRMRPAPHEGGALVVDEEAHRHDLEQRRRPPVHVEHVGRDLAVAAAEAALDAEHARHAEAPDVGVEDADGEPARRERGGEVHGDRRLADATLAARDREDARGRRHLGGRGVLAGVEAGRAASPPTSAPGVISPYSTFTRVTPGSPRTFDSTSCWICTRSGQPAVVSATRDDDGAVGARPARRRPCRGRRCRRGARGR